MVAQSAMINNLPTSILETILSLLPLKEAVRTSVLSREWKYHWTRIPKLEFVGNASGNEDKHSIQANHKLCYAINQVLSTRQGPIHEFSLSTYARGLCVEIDRIIDNLSRNDTVKKLTLDMSGYWLPESLFSLRNLTDLYLHHCRFYVQPTFSRFGSLVHVHMEYVSITKQMLLRFLSSCPLLKTVILNPYHGSLPTAIGDPTVIELFQCLPMIENLTINLPTLKCFVQGRVPKKLPAALVHLKYLCIRDAHSVNEHRIPCCAFLIRSSPNLEKLKLVLSRDLYFGIADERESYLDMWLEHLNELEIELWTRRRYRLDFVKLILAKSPALKKLKIALCNKDSRDGASKLRLEILGTLSRFPRASPVIQIIVERRVKFDRRPFERGL